MTTPDSKSTPSPPPAPASPAAIDVSIVIPAYNEELRIAKTLHDLSAYLRPQPYSHEIVVVDDGSSDGTAALIKEQFPDVRLLSYTPNRGKGHAVRLGMREAVGMYRFYYDADGSTPIPELAKTWPLFDEGADVVIGSRSLPHSDVQVHQNPLRETMGRIFNKFVKLLLWESFIDTQCGFKGFTARSAGLLFSRQQMDRFSFDAELLYLARKLGLEVRETPVLWRNSPDSRVRIIDDSLRMLYDLFRIRLRDLTGGYK